MIWEHWSANSVVGKQQFYQKGVMYQKGVDTVLMLTLSTGINQQRLFMKTAMCRTHSSSADSNLKCSGFTVNLSRCPFGARRVYWQSIECGISELLEPSKGTLPAFAGISHTFSFRCYLKVRDNRSKRSNPAWNAPRILF